MNRKRRRGGNKENEENERRKSKSHISGKPSVPVYYTIFIFTVDILYFITIVILI